MNRWRRLPGGRLSRFRGVAGWSALFVLSFVVLGLLTWLLLHRMYLQDVTEIRKRGRENLLHMSYTIPRIGEARFQDYIDRVYREGDIFSYLLVMDSRGYALAHSNPERRGMRFFEEGFREVMATGRKVEQIYIRDPHDPDSPYHGEKTIDILWPCPAGDRVYVANAGISLEAVEGIHRHYLRLGLAVIGLFLFCFLLLVWMRFRNIRRYSQIIRRKEESLRTTLDSIGDAVISTDMEGRILRMNPVAQELTGWPLAEARGRPLPQVFAIRSAEDGAPAPNPVREVLRHRSSTGIPYNTILQARDGTARHIADSAAPIRDDDGEVAGVVLVFRDITEEHATRQMLIQSEKMLSVGGLAAGMAHEINNPLGGMMQTAQVLRDRLTNAGIPANREAAEAAGISMEALRDYAERRKIPDMLERIESSGQRAAHIVRNMLSFARREGDTMAPHDPVRLIEQCLEISSVDYDLKKDYDFRRIEIVREYQEGLPPVVCEAGKIEQVVMNILRNGAEAMWQMHRSARRPHPPRFVLRLRREGETGMLRIEIGDNGPGIPEHIRRRIFEPFFTTKPTDRGTGLGLSVSYFIVTKRHGGTMWVESSPGEGATFIIRLPMKGEHRERPSADTDGPR